MIIIPLFSENLDRISLLFRNGIGVGWTPITPHQQAKHDDPTESEERQTGTRQTMPMTN